MRHRPPARTARPDEEPVIDPLFGQLHATKSVLATAVKITVAAFTCGAVVTCAVLYRNPELVADPADLPTPTATVTVTETPESDPLRAPGSMP